MSNIIIILIALTACSKGEKQVKQKPVSFELPKSYEDDLSMYRNSQNVLFRGPQSPLEDSVKLKFKGISYFEPDTSYRVIAEIERIENGPIFKMEVSGSIADPFKTIGKLHFKLKGTDQVLEVYENQDLKKSGVEFYFVPFADLTNGKETYGGGRYIELKTFEGEKTVIDFNYAYQPYCAYNHNYSCPIPPAANRMQIEIKAGEKM